MDSKRQKILRRQILFTVSLIFLGAAFLISPAYPAAKLSLSKSQLEFRMKLFYPVSDMKGKDFQKIAALVKKGNVSEALQSAEALLRARPDDKAAAYCVQALKSYSLVGEKWSPESFEATSMLLTFSAWIELHNGEYSRAAELASVCIERFRSEALRQQASLGRFAFPEDARSYWALNDVGTCLFIKGEALSHMGKYQESCDAWRDLEKNFPFAQCYDPSKGYWKAAEAAEKKASAIASKCHVRGSETVQIAKKSEKPVLVPDSIREEKKPAYIEKKIAVQPAPVKKQEVTVTERPITLRDIEDQKSAAVKKEEFQKTALEELLIEDIAPVKKQEAPVRAAAVKKEMSPAPAPKDITVASLSAAAEPEEEKKHREELARRREQVEGLNREIMNEKEEIIQMLREMGQPPVISVVLQGEKESEVLESLKKYKKEVREMMLKSGKSGPSVEVPEHKALEPAGRSRVVDLSAKRELKETVVYVRKDMTVRWTNEKTGEGLYEVLIERKGQAPEVRHFRDFSEFNSYAQELGFTI